MNLEDDKPNAVYNVRVKVQSRNEDGICVVRILDAVYGTQYHDVVITSRNLHPIPSPPKYDPCRKFRRKDKVRVKREVHGRPVYIGEDAWEPLDPNEIWEVEEEKETGWVHLKNGCLSADVWHGMLELITPVEELEPYTVVESYGRTDVMKGDYTIATYTDSHPHAKEAAEAECDRLNAEYRKEQE